MTDIFSKKKRSEIMKKIGPKNSQPEIFIRKLVHSLGFRFRLHRKNLPGKPDIVFPKYKKVIFVNGCFWHGHKNCKKSKLPETNLEFWKNKIQKNIINDKKNYSNLKKIGWDYLVIWQCQIKQSESEKIKKRIYLFINPKYNK